MTTNLDVKTDPSDSSAITAILAELAPLTDDVYPATSAIDSRFPVHTRLGTVEVFPDTMTPAAWSSTGRGLSRMMQRCAVEMGILSKSAEIPFQGIFYGHCSTNISSYIHVNRRLPGAPWLPWTQVARAVIQPHADPITGWEPPPHFGTWLVDCYWRLRGLRKSRLLEAALQAEVAPREVELVRAEAELARQDFETLDVEALIEELKRPSLNAALVRLHMSVTVFVGSHYMKLVAMLARHTSLPPTQTANALLVALGDIESAKPAKALRALATLVREAPRLAQMLRSRKINEFAAALAAPQDAVENRVGDARAEFLRLYGYRGIGEAAFDATTWAEDPSQVDSLLALYIDDKNTNDGSTVRDRREALEKDVLGQVSSPRLRQAMTTCIVKAQTFAALRERTKSMTVRQSQRTRRLLKVLTKRLVEQGVFELENDREMLSFRELTGVLKMDRGALRALIARRRGAYELLRNLDLVEMTFAGPPTPCLAKTSTAPPAPVGDILSGLGMSPGRVEGIACVVRDPRLGAELKPGEILIAPYTDAAWSPLFLLAGAVVIDSATLISHGATLARELGLPAVVNVPGTTSILSGDRVLVDAGKGEVRILARNEAPPEMKQEQTDAKACQFEFDAHRLAILRALRLKGRATIETLAVSSGLSVDQLEKALAAAKAADLCRMDISFWIPTSAGMQWAEKGLELERPEQTAALRAYEEFVPLNALFKQLAFDWQMLSPDQVNDHTDTSYDAAVLTRLHAVHQQVEPVIAAAVALVPRLAPYTTRLKHALERIKSGDASFSIVPYDRQLP